MSTRPPGSPAKPSPREQPPDAAASLTSRQGARERAAGWVGAGSRRLRAAQRRTSRVVDDALSAFESETETGGGVLAATLAFRCFLFLVPYTLVLVELAGFVFAGFSSETPVEIAHSAGVTGLIAKSLSDATRRRYWTAVASDARQRRRHHALDDQVTAEGPLHRARVHVAATGRRPPYLGTADRRGRRRVYGFQPHRRHPPPLPGRLRARVPALSALCVRRPLWNLDGAKHDDAPAR